VRENDDVSEWNYRERFVDFDHILWDAFKAALVSGLGTSVGPALEGPG